MSVMSIKAQGQRWNEFVNEFSKYQSQYIDLMQNGKHKEALTPLASGIALLDTTTIYKVASIPERAIQEQKGLLYYDQACCYAMVGQKKKALDALEQSVLLGYKDYNYMKNDNDLQSLRKEKKYLWLYPLAIVIHTVLDGFMGLSLVNVITLSDWALEAIFGICAAFVFFGAYFMLYKKDKDDIGKKEQTA